MCLLKKAWYNFLVNTMNYNSAKIVVLISNMIQLVNNVINVGTRPTFFVKDFLKADWFRAT